jgi:protein subunit release factor B
MTKELLFSITKKDFIIETFKAGGKGGQHQNKTDSAVRIKHPESGAVAESRSERSQHQNKTLAFRRLLQTNKWKTWFNVKCSKMFMSKDEEQNILETVEKLMQPSNIKIEHRIDGKWVEVTLEELEKKDE